MDDRFVKPFSSLSRLQPPVEKDGLLVAINDLPGRLWRRAVGRTAEASTEARASKMTFHPHPFRSYNRTGINDPGFIDFHFQRFLAIKLQWFHLFLCLSTAEALLYQVAEKWPSAAFRGISLVLALLDK
jgi:hypothetical protein